MVLNEKRCHVTLRCVASLEIKRVCMYVCILVERPRCSAGRIVLMIDFNALRFSVALLLQEEFKERDEWCKPAMAVPQTARYEKDHLTCSASIFKPFPFLSSLLLLLLLTVSSTTYYSTLD